MKVCIVTDLHFGYGNNSEEINDGIQRFFVEQFIPYCKKNKIKRVVILGDIFENRTTLNVRTMYIAKNVLTAISEAVDGIDMVIGNHDLYYKNSSEIDSSILFDNIPGIMIHRDSSITNMGIFYTPWIVDGTEEVRLDQMRNAGRLICAGHFDIKGFSMSQTNISTHGFDVDVFENFDLVISGHYHTRSTRKIGNTTFVYIGSPYQLNRGDCGEDRGFMVLDTDTCEFEFVDNTVSPRFVKLQFPNKFKVTDVRGNFIDIIVSCENDTYNEKMLEKYITSVESLEPITKPKIQILSTTTGSEIDFDIELENMSTTTKLIAEYVNKEFGELGEKDYLLTKIMEVFEKVS